MDLHEDRKRKIRQKEGSSAVGDGKKKALLKFLLYKSLQNLEMSF